MRGAKIAYSADEMAWLEANRTLVISDYHCAFVEAFARADVSAQHLHALRKRKGWKVGRAKGRTAGRHWRFGLAEIAWLEANRTLEIAAYHSSFCAEFGRQDVSAAALHSLRKRQGWRTGRTGQFAKGHISANKGKRCPEGIGGRSPNARRTQFKPGQEPHNTKFLGHERVHPGGYVLVSVDEPNPHTGYARRYVLKHVHLWEQLNGPVPDGHCLKCLGDRSNSDPSNWELVPKAIIPRLNGGRSKALLAFDDAAPEVRPILIAVAKVAHRARQLLREHKTGGDA
jgi:hypothetical protein